LWGLLVGGGFVEVSLSLGLRAVFIACTGRYGPCRESRIILWPWVLQCLLRAIRMPLLPECHTELMEASEELAYRVAVFSLQASWAPSGRHGCPSR
jgi:hypothetical protein